MYEYFLTHRAWQIQRLCASQSPPRIDLPSRLARSISSKRMADLCRTIESICRLKLGSESESQGWSWLNPFRARPQEGAREEQGPAQPMLATDARELINRLETDLVRVRLSDEAAAAEMAANVMQAIWLDRDFFHGLKPLAAHTDNFAFEFLYPTWFNLYTALVDPERPERGYATEQIKTLFRFLDAYENQGASRDPELVGLLTLIAHRHPAEEGLLWLQRLLDLCGCPESDLSVAAVAVVRPLRDVARNVGQLLPLVKDYLLVESGLRRDAIRSAYHLVPGGLQQPHVPAVIGKVLRQLEPQLDRDEGYVMLVHRAGRIAGRSGGFDGDFERVLAANEAHVAELLALLFPSEEDPSPLSPAGQGLVARLLEKEQESTGQLDLSRVRPFARDVAPRMEPLDESLAALWDTEFVRHVANRRILLEACSDPAARTQVASRLLAGAKKATDDTRFLDLVELAAILDPGNDHERLGRIRLSTRVLRMAIAAGYILQSQWAALKDDLQQHLPQSMAYLESPTLAAASKPERLAKLYLTLNEERESYAQTGQIRNFAITHAAYSKLTRLSNDETQ